MVTEQDLKELDELAIEYGVDPLPKERRDKLATLSEDEAMDIYVRYIANENSQQTVRLGVGRLMIDVGKMIATGYLM